MENGTRAGAEAPDSALWGPIRNASRVLKLLEVLMAESFVATLPFSILAINPRFDADGCWRLKKEDAVVGALGGDAVVLPLFTDDDLADRYNSDGGYGAEVILIDDPEAAAEVVSKLHKLHAVTHVAFDPVHGQPPRWVETVAEFLESLRRSTQSQQDQNCRRQE